MSEHDTPQERLTRLAVLVVETFGPVPFVLAVHPGAQHPVMTCSSLSESLQAQLLRHLVESFERGHATTFPIRPVDVQPGYVTAADMRLAAAELSTKGARHCANVARWLVACADTLEAKPKDPSRCECGASLAQVPSGGAVAELCPECDRELLEEIQG